MCGGVRGPTCLEVIRGFGDSCFRAAMGPDTTSEWAEECVRFENSETESLDCALEKFIYKRKERKKKSIASDTHRVESRNLLF